MPRFHITKFPLSKGKSLVSVAEVHSFICSEVIFLSARAGAVHSFICGTGASADQTAAAVGRQNACPSGAVLQSFRGRRQFEYAVRYTFPAKSRPLEAILYVHRPRSRAAMPSLHEMPRLRLRECLASASRTASSSPPGMPSSPGMPCLRFTNCLAFTLRNFRSAKANLLC